MTKYFDALFGVLIRVSFAAIVAIMLWAVSTINTLASELPWTFEVSFHDGNGYAETISRKEYTTEGFCMSTLGAYASVMLQDETVTVSEGITRLEFFYYAILTDGKDSMLLTCTESLDKEST